MDLTLGHLHYLGGPRLSTCECRQPYFLQLRLLCHLLWKSSRQPRCPTGPTEVLTAQCAGPFKAGGALCGL